MRGADGVWSGRMRPTVPVVSVIAACSAAGTDVKPAESATPPVKEADQKAGSPLAARGLVPPPPSEAMVQQMQVQLVLDHPRVAPYLHSESAANVPLAVFASADLALGAGKVKVAGQPVRVVAAEGEARVVLRGRESVGPAKVRVKFEIPPEGVSGHVDLQLADYVWSAVDARVVER